MTTIDLGSDLEQVNKQLEDLVGQLNTLNTQREQLTQQIHNLNGIAMYLRGKQPPEEEESATETSPVINAEDIPTSADDSLERSNEYPSDVNT